MYNTITHLLVLNLPITTIYNITHFVFAKKKSTLYFFIVEECSCYTKLWNKYVLQKTQ